MMLMGRQLTASINDIFEEWIEIQRDTAIILKQKINLIPDLIASSL